MQKLSARQIFLIILVFFFLSFFFSFLKPQEVWADAQACWRSNNYGCANFHDVNCSVYGDPSSCTHNQGPVCDGEGHCDWTSCNWDPNANPHCQGTRTCNTIDSFCSRGFNSCQSGCNRAVSVPGPGNIGLYLGPSAGCSGTASSCTANAFYAFYGGQNNLYQVLLVDNTGYKTILYSAEANEEGGHWLFNRYGTTTLNCGKQYWLERRFWDICHNDDLNCGITESTGLVSGPSCPADPPTCSFPSTSTVTTTVNTATNYSASTTNSTSSNIYTAPQSTVNGWSSAYPNPASISFGSAGNKWVVCNASGAGGNCTGNPWCNFNGANSCAASSRSVNAWIKTSASGPNQQIYSTYDGTNGWQIYVNGAGYASIWTNNGSITNPNIKVNNGQWHMVTGILDGNYAYLYVDGGNGVSSNPTTVRPTSTTKDNQIGAECGGDGSTSCGSYFKGAIDEVGIWGRNLYDSDITALYNAGAGRSFGSLSTTVPATQNTSSGYTVPVSQFLLAYWTLDSKAASDSLGIYNGTAVGTNAVTGKIGTALEFNAPDSNGKELVKISTPSNINTTGCTSCSGWTDCGGSSRIPVAVTNAAPPTCTASLTKSVTFPDPFYPGNTGGMFANAIYNGVAIVSWAYSSNNPNITVPNVNSSLNTVTAGLNSGGQSAIITATATLSPGGNSCSATLPIFVTNNVIPWFQTSGGNVWGKNTVDDRNLPNGKSIATGIVETFGSINSGAGSISPAGNLVNYPLNPSIANSTSYSSLLTAVAKNSGAGSSATLDSTVCANPGTYTALPGYTFYCYTPSTFFSLLQTAAANTSTTNILYPASGWSLGSVSNPVTINSKTIIFANGNLFVNANVTVGANGGAVFATLGDLILDPAVSRLDGVYLFPGSFNNGAGASQLIGNGSLLGTGTFTFSRTFTGGPAENWTYEPKYLDLFKKILSTASYTWKELPPQ